MLEKAIEKIKSEMDKNKGNSYIQVVGGFLLQYLNQNPGSAEKILQDEKTIAKSFDEMRKAAEKKKVGNCAMLTDQEGFEVVLKYFGIDGKVTVRPATAKEDKVQAIKTPEPESNADFDVKLEDFLG